MRKKHLSEGRYLFLAFFFVGLVVFIILASFTWKGIVLLQGSKFDGTHEFILGLFSQGRKVELVVFRPEDKTVTLFTALNNADGIFPVPLDLKVAGEQRMSADSQTLLHDTLFSSLTPQVNILDKYKLWFFGKSANITAISAQAVTSDFIKKYADIFIDKDIYQEAKSVAIINATGESGVGNTMSQMLSVIGVNVISVGSIDEEQNQTSMQYAGETSYTLSRLERIFGVQAEKSTNPSPLADITIIVGKDYLSVNRQP